MVGEVVLVAISRYWGRHTVHLPPGCITLTPNPPCSPRSSATSTQVGAPPHPLLFCLPLVPLVCNPADLVKNIWLVETYLCIWNLVRFNIITSGHLSLDWLWLEEIWEVRALLWGWWSFLLTGEDSISLIFINICIQFSSCNILPWMWVIKLMWINHHHAAGWLWVELTHIQWNISSCLCDMYVYLLI